MVYMKSSAAGLLLVGTCFAAGWCIIAFPVSWFFLRSSAASGIYYDLRAIVNAFPLASLSVALALFGTGFGWEFLRLRRDTR